MRRLPLIVILLLLALLAMGQDGEVFIEQVKPLNSPEIDQPELQSIDAIYIDSRLPVLVHVSYKLKRSWGNESTGAIAVYTNALAPRSKPGQLLDDVIAALAKTGRLKNIDFSRPGRNSLTILGWRVMVPGALDYSTDGSEVYIPKPPKPVDEVPLPADPIDKE